MMQQVGVDSAVGRAVRGFFFTWDGRAVVVFADDTFVALRARSGYDGSGPDLEEDRDFDVRTFDKAVEAGLLTKEEKAAIEAEQARKWREAAETRERSEYERLRRKFGDPDT